MKFAVTCSIAMLACSAASARSLPEGSIVVATDAGVYWIDAPVGSSATLLASAASLGGLTAPATSFAALPRPATGR